MIGLSVASAGCKDRRLLDGTGSTTTTKAIVKKSTTGAAATTSIAVATVPAPVVTDPPVQMAEYVLVSGDTLFGIAKKFGVSVATLMAANNLTDANKVQVGQKLKIPIATGTPATPKPAQIAGTGTYPPVTVADTSTQTSIVTITVVVNVPKTTVKP